MDFDPRDHDSRDRDGRDTHDPRDVFMRDLDLPRGADREIVRDRDHEYSLRGSETRTLSTVGAFRVVPASKLRDHSGAPADPRQATSEIFASKGWSRRFGFPAAATMPWSSPRAAASFWSAIATATRVAARPTTRASNGRASSNTTRRSMTPIFTSADRLHEQGARIDRVVLDYELKRDYQKWLHENDREARRLRRPSRSRRG